MLTKKERKDIYKLRGEIYANYKLIEKSDWIISNRKKKKLAEKNEEIDKKLNYYREKYNDPNIDVKIYEEEVNNSKWTKIGDAMYDFGDNLERTGKSMVKTGAKTTAITWTPLLYVGYKTGKLALEKDETPESQYVKLIKECEEAYQKGKIDEETLKYYIRDYANNHYRL